MGGNRGHISRTFARWLPRRCNVSAPELVFDPHTIRLTNATRVTPQALLMDKIKLGQEPLERRILCLIRMEIPQAARCRHYGEGGRLRFRRAAASRAQDVGTSRFSRRRISAFGMVGIDARRDPRDISPSAFSMVNPPMAKLRRRRDD